MGPEVTFSLRLDDGQLVEADAFPDHRPAVAKVLAGGRPPFGVLILRGGGQSELILPDDLLPLADSLVAVLPALASGGAGDIAGYSQPFSWHFTHAAGRTRTADRDGITRDDEAAALLTALTRGADTLVTCLRGGGLTYPNASRLLEGMTAKLAA